MTSPQQPGNVKLHHRPKRPNGPEGPAREVAPADVLPDAKTVSRATETLLSAGRTTTASHTDWPSYGFFFQVPPELRPCMTTTMSALPDQVD